MLVVSVGTMVLWWNFYVEYDKCHQFSQTFNHPLTENNRTLNESFSQTNETFSETFVEAGGTYDETFSHSSNVANKFQIPLLFVGVDTKNMFLTLSVIASVFTVRCYYVVIMCNAISFISTSCLVLIIICQFTHNINIKQQYFVHNLLRPK